VNRLDNIERNFTQDLVVIQIKQIMVHPMRVNTTEVLILALVHIAVEVVLIIKMRYNPWVKM